MTRIFDFSPPLFIARFNKNNYFCHKFVKHNLMRCFYKDPFSMKKYIYS